MCTVCESNFEAFKIISRIKSWPRRRYRGWKKKRNVFAVLCRKRHVQSAKKVDCDESVIVIATSFFFSLMSVRSPSAYTLFIYTGYIPYRNISLMRLYLFAIDAESLTMYMYTDKYIARARVTNFLGGREGCSFFGTFSPCMMLCFNSFRPPRSLPSTTSDSPIRSPPTARVLSN